MNNLAYAIDILEKRVIYETNKSSKIISIYKEMIDYALENNDNIELLIDEIQQIGAIISTLFYIFDFKNEAKHTSLSTTRLANITQKVCQTHPRDKMCLDCWKLSYLYCKQCLNAKLVHNCDCQFNCCKI